MRSLKTARVDQVHNLLHLEFERDVGHGVLHELSLADASYVHPSNLTKDWRITSGPYSVESYDLDSMLLLLRRNQFAPRLVDSTGPELVRLFWTKEANFQEFYTKEHADLFTSDAFSFRNKVRVLDQIAAQRIVSIPTTVYYFELDQRDTRAASPGFRRALSEAMAVPFANELAPLYTSSRVDVSLWNKFDMRLRFYEARWR